MCNFVFQIFYMIRNVFILIITVLFVISCKDDDANIAVARLKESKKKEVVFATINDNWNFPVPELQPQSQSLVQDWSVLRLFLAELKQKPKNSIGAFQKKTKTLSKLADSINKTVPQTLQKPAIKSRLVVLLTHIRSLDLYVNLQNIPTQKAIYSIAEINLALGSFQMQLDEIVRKTQIPLENGESDLIRILDTARAIPDNQKTEELFPD